MGALFKQLPQTQIGPKFKKICVHQIANDQTIVLSHENVKSSFQAQILMKSKNVYAQLPEDYLGIEIF